VFGGAGAAVDAAVAARRRAAVSALRLLEIIEGSFVESTKARGRSGFDPLDVVAL
jgi:hypothetical protein